MYETIFNLTVACCHTIKHITLAQWLGHCGTVQSFLLFQQGAGPELGLRMFGYPSLVSTQCAGLGLLALSL